MMLSLAYARMGKADDARRWAESAERDPAIGAKLREQEAFAAIAAVR